MGNLTIRITDEERQIWSAAADQDERTLGSWIRRQCNAALTERGMPPTGHSLKPDAARDGDVPGMSVETGPGGASPAPRSVSPEQPRISAQQYQREFRPDFKDKK